jgi:hypothetical protein
MNFYHLNKNKKSKNPAHSAGLEFGPRPGIVGAAPRPKQHERPMPAERGMCTTRAVTSRWAPVLAWLPAVTQRGWRHVVGGWSIGEN